MGYRYNVFTGQLDFVQDGNGSSDFANQFVTDSGTAVPAANIINFLGDSGQGISSAGSGNTVTYTIADATESQKGVTELATDAEAIAGANTTNAIVPSSLTAKLGNQTANAIPYGQGASSAIGWSSALTDGQLMIGATGMAPAAANLISSDASIAITNGVNSIDLTFGGAVASSFITDSGTAVPSGGELQIVGGNAISTSGASNIVTIDLVAPVSVPNGGTGLTTITDGGILLGSGTAAITVTAQPTDGQLLIGSSGSDPVLGSLASAGGTITITPGAGTINLEAVDQFPWNVESGTSANMAVNNGYIGNNAAGVTFTLPDTAAVGDIVRVTGLQASWTIAQNAGETIYFGNDATTTGVGGSLSSTNARDVVELVCVVANTDWQVLSSIGNITVT